MDRWGHPVQVTQHAGCLLEQLTLDTARDDLPEIGTRLSRSAIRGHLGKRHPTPDAEHACQAIRLLVGEREDATEAGRRLLDAIPLLQEVALGEKDPPVLGMARE